ncbi:hypothetical protein H311_00269 [Anncaliia algerae PRA109]|nr:hypothetical protein H311_00269 [Anncaliia algerae PRA109]
MVDKEGKCSCYLNAEIKGVKNFYCRCECHSYSNFGYYTFEESLLGSKICKNTDEEINLNDKIAYQRQDKIGYDINKIYFNRLDTSTNNLEMKEYWHNINDHDQSMEITKNNDDLYCNPNLNFLYTNLKITSLSFNDYIFNIKNRLVSKHMYAGITFYEYYNTIDGTLFFCGNINCKKKYTTRNGIIYHIESGCRNKNSRYRFFCPHPSCNKKFKTKNGFKYHIESKHYRK